jgi:hypothetical protein
VIDVRGLRVRDVMTPCPQTITVDTPIVDAYALLVESALSGLPIVDAEGRVQGLFSLTDLAAELEPVLHPASDGDPGALGPAGAAGPRGDPGVAGERGRVVTTAHREHDEAGKRRGDRAATEEGWNAH